MSISLIMQQLVDNNNMALSGIGLGVNTKYIDIIKSKHGKFFQSLYVFKTRKKKGE